MFYRENGQFKTSYQADQQIFPIVQDRWFILALLLLAFVGVPFFATDYLFSAILIPFVIMAMAAVGVNISAKAAYAVMLGGGRFGAAFAALSLAAGAAGALALFFL